MDNSKNPLKVALHGMDGRSYKMMTLYLEGPCKGAAQVVSEGSSEADIFDVDALNADKLLAEHMAKNLTKPLILLSLTDRGLDNTIFVKKPVKLADLLDAINKAKSILVGQTKTVVQKNDITQVSQRSSEATHENEPPAAQPLKRFVLDTDEQKKTAKHQAAMQLNERGFNAFIGNVPGIDVNDPKQFAKASYNPKDYYQGYVESAFKVSQEKGQQRQLNSGWNPLLLYPQTNEVWLDVDDNQLRAFSGLAISHTLASKMSITPISQELSAVDKTLEKFQSIDAFLWKIACWASKGRYPAHIDINQPVYLKSWPNFTRLLVTPHALRITALLIRGPRTLPEVAEQLHLKPQYVFVFISAACSLGLVGQAKRGVDTLLGTPEIKPNKNQGLLGRILSVLRGKKA